MQVRKVQADSNEVETKPSAMEVVFADVAGFTDRLQLRPPAELSEIAEIRGALVKAVGENSQFVTDFASAMNLELERRLNRFERFGGQGRYLRSVADIAALAGQLETEATHLADALERVPSISTRRRLAENRLLSNEPQVARQILMAAELQDDVQSKLRLGYIAMHSDDVEGAMRCVLDALEIDPTDYSARLFEGALHLAGGHPKFAIRSFRVALRERPSSSVLHCNLGIAYLQLNETTKALEMVRRAVILCPINVSALGIYADLARRLDQDEIVIKPLSHFLETRPDDPKVWAYLARAKYFTKDYPGALEALKHEAALNESSAMWNNMGAVFLKMGQGAQALKRLAHALKVAENETPNDVLRTARNLARVLANQRKHREVLALVDGVKSFDSSDLLIRDQQLSDLTAFRIRAMINLGQHDVVRVQMRELIERVDTAPSLKHWIVTAGIAFAAYVEGFEDFLRYLADIGENLMERDEITSLDDLVALSNNVAFARAEVGDLDRAAVNLRRVLWATGSNPFVTATLGLIALRRGQIDRGTALYRKAIQLARSHNDSVRIRQKLNLELARCLAQSDPKKAAAPLKRVLQAKDGQDKHLSSQARVLLDTLENQLRRK